MNSDSLIDWLEAVCDSLGRGSHKIVADTLGMSTSNLSKVFERRAGFDEKTLRLMSWILTSKDEDYKDEKLLWSNKSGQFLICQRELKNGEKVITWKPIDPTT
jgi:hypothetical protein